MIQSLVRVPVLVFAALSAAACYRYVPAVESPPKVGDDIRAHLTAEGTQNLATTLGADIVAFDGKLLSDENGVLRFSLTQTRARSDRRTNWTGETVQVPASAIARTELRTLDRPRTIRATLASAAGGVAVGLVIKGLAGKNGGGGGKGGPPPQ
jgi:hypothetical protein